MNRSRIWRWPILLALLVTFALGASGCTGGARATSWTGLTIVEETLYAADLRQVVALDADDGEVRWAFPQDPGEDSRGTFQAGPAVGEGVVIAASQMPPSGFLGQARNVVWGLDVETGNLKWHFDEARGQYIEGGAIRDGLCIIGNGDGNIYALDIESGDLKWTFETDHRVWATPLIISDTAYIGSMDRHLYALRLSDGEKLWRFPADGDAADGAFASTPVLQDDTLYIGAFDDRLYAISAETGTKIWSFPGENWFWGSPVIYGDTVYATDVNGNVYALDAETGEEIWREPLEAKVRAGPAVAEDGSKLFVGSQNGTLYAMDTADGLTLWPRESEGQVFSRPVVNGELVYEALIYGPYRIRALHEENGREVWIYPQVEEE